MSRAPETLAIRAVNQYRRRDLIGYLGLRLYLDSTCSRRDRWSQEIAVHLALHNQHPQYYRSLHFKERCSKPDKIIYRPLRLPGPNEIMAEAALLNVCSHAGAPFVTPDAVYSYRLAGHSERRGIFVPYYEGFRQRHADIAKAADSCPDGVVLYTDIRRFYPSIPSAQARNAWSATAAATNLLPWVTLLGHKLLDGYASNCDEDENGILTGPMFAHLIGNLVLVDLDKEMMRALPHGYFRYVDDIVLVGARGAVFDAEKRLNEWLSSRYYETKSDKRYEVPVSHWLSCRDDFAEDRDSVTWKTFVGRLKQLLLAHPERTQALTNRLADEGIRLTPLDYTAAVRERAYLSRMYGLVRWGWFRRALHGTTPDTVCKQGLQLRRRYQESFWTIADGIRSLTGFDRKRWLYLLRRYASRLVYLASPDDLATIAETLTGVPEMELYEVVFSCLASRDVTRLLEYGPAAAHSASQALLVSDRPVVCSVSTWTDAHRQALAVLIATGVKVESAAAPSPLDVERFSDWDTHGLSLLEQPDTYFGQLACLHGQDVGCRHEHLLRTAFDADEDTLVDIEDVLTEYS